MNSLFEYKKRKTNTVTIGTLQMGSDFPVRIQSMTNTDTNDAEATADQIIEIADAGADLVRITVQTSNVAEKIKDIKHILKAKKYAIPLVADIHFSPKAAEAAATMLEKVRINPGNYIDKKQFKHIAYTDVEYQSEIDKIRENILPLLNICKANKTAIRIGTNHGSLSDRIMSRYGDTPEGMTESTMEFLRICKEEQFQDVVISMKASNPIVMVQAVRFLVQKMDAELMNYPIHLGVTEAGNELEGRIKSAVGIGSLLIDGIGDTIRVSLTESPANEIPCAIQLAELFNKNTLNTSKLDRVPEFKDFDPLKFKKRKTKRIGIIGGNTVPVVISEINEAIDRESLKTCGFQFNADMSALITSDLSSDFIYTDSEIPKKTDSYRLRFISKVNHKKRFSFNAFSPKLNYSDKPDFLEINPLQFSSENFETLKALPRTVLVLNFTDVPSPVHVGRAFFAGLSENGIQNPVVFKKEVAQIAEKDVLQLSAEFGSLFLDGFGDGLWIKTKTDESVSEARELAFGILQACRTRTTKTEYISCPSCGRTLFNLEETTARIKKKTAHLKGIKIGIMGCIVNGPGEMADADFGYVGTGSGKVTLYRRQDVIKRNIPEENAVDELLNLIEQYLKKN
jgi:(E)-4-hydroxy-3-methylbut-2-enyl-diphosphate synthase